MIFVVDITGEPIVCTNEDGETLFFLDKDEAEEYGKRNIQQYVVVVV